ncbi:PLP-dependent aminotransferase family protein [Pseudobacillus badius]|uniref:MocR-like pyridoxine biosynthesis transcription factor PdxR n=1 Tax=Bacillus badius TaxID=1455 RepID=UPI0007B08834|nr:PLP-dependent aminotransferase family protein [Bacillus badius]KZN99707.1 GntR family transcriptional regulator [Bacillus badius]OCS85811.1 GntR family transcriptional regulator [Bacillus badius]OVE51831.1 GntR family transcriptional regulator [Bacillus badius]TDW03257.1 GntR family transcriptional regulator [Bacillus badius]UAT32229.1 PLP-dependent aminotransferase family protein [Bacillus badius]
MGTNLAKYEKVMNYIKKAISSGEWPIGSKIPSQRKLAELLSVNRSTIVTALEELKTEGLIEGVMGKGTMVVNNTWTLLAASPPSWDESAPFSAPKPLPAPVLETDGVKAPEHFIELSKGELAQDIFPTDNMQQVMMRLAQSLEPFGYEEPKGYLPLRKAISDYMRKQGTDISPASILIVSGAIQGLQLISAGLLHKGSTVFLEKPSYLYSLHTFQSAGMNLSGLPMDEEGLRADALLKKAMAGPASVLYTIPCFHNPTGILMSEARRKELLDVCAEKRLPVIEDDIYRELWMDSPPPPTLQSLDANGHVLYIGSFSKTLTPGLRIGWIAGSEQVIERLAEIKKQTDYGSSSLSQLVAAEWISSGLYEQHLSFVRKELKKRRTAALHALNEHMSDLAEWDIPAGGFLIWLRMKEGIQLKDIYSKAYRAGLSLNVGSIYTGESVQAIRLSYGYASIEEFEQGIRKLRQIILEDN